MSDCTERRMRFGCLGRRVIEADFDGGVLSSDGGLMLVRRVDQRIGLSRAAATAIGDARDPSASSIACTICSRSACTRCATATRT